MTAETVELKQQKAALENRIHSLLEQNRQIKQQNATLLKALKEISWGEGVWNTDRLTHAENIIENMVLIAKQALALAIGE